MYLLSYSQIKIIIISSSTKVGSTIRSSTIISSSNSTISTLIQTFFLHNIL